MRWLLLLILLISCEQEDMKPFIVSLSTEQSEPPDVGTGVIPDMSSATLVISANTDLAAQSIYWFQVYRTSDFPLLTGITKDYFALYSTDHQIWGAYWGQFDNLDLSDFTEMGKCFTTASSQETPRIYTIGSNLCFFEHHGVGATQQTFLWTSTGGSLTNMDTNGSWTNRGNVFGLHTAALGNQLRGVDESHTGYAVLYKTSPTVWTAYHLVVGGSPTSVVMRMSTSTDGINWTRGDDINLEVAGAENYLSQFWNYIIELPSGTYGFGQGRVITPEGDNTNRQIAYNLASDFKSGTLNRFLSATEMRRVDYFRDGNTLHVYYSDQREEPNNLYHATIDITNL